MRTTDPPCTRHIAMPVLSADGTAQNLSISVHGNYSSTRGRNSRESRANRRGRNSRWHKSCSLIVEGSSNYLRIGVVRLLFRRRRSGTAWPAVAVTNRDRER
ncbi:hypothetical protein SESBI_17414 [Sesbania bispinosa]|nr:hypothetical protein SESBI_17414 [Sesbania bispinosa]